MFTDKKRLMEKADDEQEKLLLAKAADKARLCLKTGEAAYTDFLSPKLRGVIAEAFSFSQEISRKPFGGYDDSERVMIGFYPSYLPEPDDGDFPIKTICVKQNEKFAVSLSHRDYLGSVIGLGVDRRKIGDIVIDGANAYIFVERDIADYIKSSVTKIGGATVKAEFSELSASARSNGREKTLLLASSRLDVVIGEGFNLSRAQAKKLIENQKVNLNFTPETKTHTNVNEGDIISVRGFGRLKAIAVEGKTKKDKIILHTQIFK